MLHMDSEIPVMLVLNLSCITVLIFHSTLLFSSYSRRQLLGKYYLYFSMYFRTFKRSYLWYRLWYILPPHCGKLPKKIYIYFSQSTVTITLSFSKWGSFWFCDITSMEILWTFLTCWNLLNLFLFILIIFSLPKSYLLFLIYLLLIISASLWCYFITLIWLWKELSQSIFLIIIGLLSEVNVTDNFS